MNSDTFFIALYGPTSVGKTALADQLAQSLPIEIINMDVGQLYKPFTIGTAKPDWQSEKTPHHLFDILDTPTDFSVSQYRNLVWSLIKKVRKRKKIPVLVGGSGFYLKSLFFPPSHSSSVVNEGKLIAEKYSHAWQQLYTIDPKRAKQVHKNDTYRIKRALDIWYTTGKKPSSCVPTFDPIGYGIVVHITRDRNELYARIDKRTLQMIKQGWFDEVRSLDDTTWCEFIYKKKLIGYDTILAYLSGNQSDKTDEQIVADIQRKTRNYAKRQMTFWRMLERSINDADPEQKKVFLSQVDLTLSEPDLYINQLINLITRRVK